MLNVVEVYDPIKDVWTVFHPMLNARCMAAAATL